MTLLFLFSCNTSKKFAKTADEFATKGDYNEAATYYYNALLKKPKNAHAQSGLRSNGQLVLNEKFATFAKNVREQNIDAAIKQYGYAEKYAANAASVGVQLSWAYEYDEVYADIKQEYVDKLFNDALHLMQLKKYDLAEKNFEQMSAYDSTFKGVSVLRLHTVLEPLYNRGMQELLVAKYKDAFRTFSKLCDVDADYKDAKIRREEAAAKATTKVGLLPVQSVSNVNYISSKLDELLAQKIKFSSSFLHIVSAAELLPVLQLRGFTSFESDTVALEAAQSLGLRFALFVKIEEVTDSSGKKQDMERTAYEAVTENVPNPYTGTYTYISKFKKITYNDSYEFRKVKYVVYYCLWDVATKKQLESETLYKGKSDEKHAYVFNGKPNKLYEHLPQNNQMPPPNPEWRERFYENNRSLLTFEELLTEISYETANEIYRKVQKHLK